MREAAARPVIVPDQVVIDHGKVFVSDTFVRACDRLGISVQPARKDTPTDKGVVEATFTSRVQVWLTLQPAWIPAWVAARRADARNRACR